MKRSDRAQDATRARQSAAALPAELPRLHQKALIRIFQYLSVDDLFTCMRVCKLWNHMIETYDAAIWERHAIREVPEPARTDPLLFGDSVRSHRDRLRAFRHAWNPADISRNNFVRTNGFTVHRQPVAQSTDGVRGKRGASVGAHAWEITWDGPLGTAAVVGIATRHAALHCPGYMPLIGSDDQSWGWNLVDNALLHNGGVVTQYPRVNNPPKYLVGERIRMVLDCDNNALHFEKGTEFLGVAFRQLPPVKLFPATCAVYGNTEVTMVYVGQPLVG